nr:hypothetical protein [Tanacetum cinerariifolium]
MQTQREAEQANKLSDLTSQRQLLTNQTQLEGLSCEDLSYRGKRICNQKLCHLPIPIPYRKQSGVSGWDLLFQPMFDELLIPPPSVVNQAPEVIAPIAEVIPQIDANSTSSPSSTTVDQDAPSSSKSHTTTEIQSSVISQDVGDDNLDMKVAHMGNDPLIGVP